MAESTVSALVVLEMELDRCSHTFRRGAPGTVSLVSWSLFTADDAAAAETGQKFTIDAAVEKGGLRGRLKSSQNGDAGALNLVKSSLDQ